jgi:hypothetical protein
MPAPAKYRLVAGLLNCKSENDWDIWVYPPSVQTEIPNDIAVVNELNDEALNKLEKGGKVLLLIQPSRVCGDKHGKVALGFHLYSGIPHDKASTTAYIGNFVRTIYPLFSEFPTNIIQIGSGGILSVAQAQ